MSEKLHPTERRVGSIPAPQNYPLKNVHVWQRRISQKAELFMHLLDEDERDGLPGWPNRRKCGWLLRIISSRFCRFGRVAFFEWNASTFTPGITPATNVSLNRSSKASPSPACVPSPPPPSLDFPSSYNRRTNLYPDGGLPDTSFRTILTAGLDESSTCLMRVSLGSRGSVRGAKIAYSYILSGGMSSSDRKKIPSAWTPSSLVYAKRKNTRLSSAEQENEKQLWLSFFL